MKEIKLNQMDRFFSEETFIFDNLRQKSPKYDNMGWF